VFVIDELAISNSFSIINRDRHFVFMTATAESPVSYNYVVTKGIKTFIALSDKIG
jgi:hypothetical protein